MPLFHPRVVKKHLAGVPQPSAAHIKILNDWSDNLSKGVYDSETKNDGQFIQRILVELLGYTESSQSPNWNLQKNQPIGKGNVDAALGAFSVGATNIVAPFELKGAKTKDLDAIMPGRGKSPVEQAWEYAVDAKGAKWVLVSNFEEIRLYGFGYGKKDYERFDLRKPLSDSNYERMMLLLSADNLLGGQTADLLLESEQAEKEITDEFYIDYKKVRQELISTIAADNPAVSALDVINFSQTILDRVLFIAFAEDRQLLPKATLAAAYKATNPFSPQPVWDNFKGLFKAIDQGNSSLKIPHYNGGLFSDNSDINNLKVSDTLCQHFKNIGGYDFDSDVSVNILGHIFEQSISDIEEIKLAAVGITAPPKRSKRKRDGVYYTPPHVTRYIVEQAVGGWLAERKEAIGFAALPELEDDDYRSIIVLQSGKNKGAVRYNKRIKAHIDAWEAYKKVLSEIKVLDPACGSGAFLNEVFDYLLKEGQAINAQLTTLHGGQFNLFRWDTHILSNNLFGVDVNRESVEISKLSLWLKTANRSEKLTYLDDNIRWGNSLVADPALVGDAAFDWWKEFPNIKKAGGFDVIVGNPPYVLSRDNTLDVIKTYARKHYSLYDDKINLYLLFIEKSLDLISLDGMLSFIVPNSFMGVESAIKCREHLVKNTQMKAVINLLGTTFKGVNVEAVVFCTRKAVPHKNTVQVGNVSQPRQLDEPLASIAQDLWLNTENVSFDIQSSADHHSLLDKIAAFPKLSENFTVRTGLQAYERGKGTPAQTEDDVKNHPFDYTYQYDQDTYQYLEGGDVGRYRLNWSGQWLRWGPWLSQPRDLSMFSSPRVLIREITGPYPRVLISTYVADTYLNNKSIINVLEKTSGVDLRYLTGLLNSKIIGFYHSRRAVKGNRTLFPKAVIADVNNYPIPVSDKEQRSKVVAEVDRLLQAHRALDKIAKDFVALLAADLGLVKISGKLHNWYELSPKDFIEQLETSKKGITLKQKAEWLDLHRDKAKKTSTQQQIISQANAAIDAMAYKIYGLTADEISAIENG